MLISSEKYEGPSGHEAGRRLLAQLYRQATGQPLPPILVTDRGKPYFATGDLCFSISHTKNRVFCALADHPIGIDAEPIDRNIDLRLAEKILSTPEKARFARAKDPREALLRLWVLKEATAKFTGEGLRGYPNHTDLSPEDPRIQIIHGCFVAVIESKENENAV